jgi:hypothetical protein
MKTSTILTISALLLVCASPMSQSEQTAAKLHEADAEKVEPMFLHLLAPKAHTDPPLPAHRIVTVRVYPFQEISISIGDAEDPFTDGWEGAWTNPQWSKDSSPEPRPLEPVWNSGDAVLAGRIERVNGKFFARLQGRNRTTLNYFHGEIELEKPVYEQGGFYRGGVIWPVWFALSSSPDCTQFLKALEDGRLRRSNVVDLDSPARKRWQEGEHNSPPRSPRVEPSDPPNDGPATSV